MRAMRPAAPCSDLHAAIGCNMLLQPFACSYVAMCMPAQEAEEKEA